MESKMQDVIEGGINERDSLYGEIDGMRADLQNMTKERDAACDAANEFLDNNRQLRENLAAEVQKRIAVEDALISTRAALESCVIVLEACSARKIATVKRVASEAREIMTGLEIEE